MTAVEHSAWIELAGGQALWDELSGGFGIKPLLAGNTGTQMGGWFKRPVTSLADLAGLNFRMPGLGGEVWRRLGMNVVNLPGSQILAALDAGTLDGTDWVGPWNDTEWGFQRVATNYYTPSLSEGGAALTLGVGRRIWDALPAADQAIFRAACGAESALMMAEFHLNNARALAALKAEGRVTIRPFPNDVIARIGEVAPDVAASAATDDLGRRILASYLGARDAMRPWTQLAEPEFIAARQRILG